MQIMRSGGTTVVKQCAKWAGIKQHEGGRFSFRSVLLFPGAEMGDASLSQETEGAGGARESAEGQCPPEVSGSSNPYMYGLMHILTAYAVLPSTHHRISRRQLPHGFYWPVLLR